jgi:predicted Holliday junction resolvase-like endonuclease
MHSNHAYITMEVRRHAQQLQSWATQVVSARLDVDAFRIAARAPARSGVLSACQALVRSDKSRAETKVKNNLEKRLRQMSREDIEKHRSVLLHSTRGRYPSLAYEIQKILSTSA